MTLNVTYGDAASMALGAALAPGALRYPGGTNANVWNLTRGGFVLPPWLPDGYGKYAAFAPLIDAFAPGTFGAPAFARGLGGAAQTVLWNINVYTDPSPCATLQQLAVALPGRVSHIELGNELYIPSQGLPRFPNASAYAAAMQPVLRCARVLFPNATIAAVGATGAWNAALRPHLAAFDALTIHRYAPTTPEVQALPPESVVKVKKKE